MAPLAVLVEKEWYMFTRYAVYFTPKDDLAAWGAAWLGWDVALNVPVPHPQVTDLDVAAMTKVPRKYGFHGTIKPPFHLAEGTDVGKLSQSLARLCGGLAPVVFDGLKLSRLGPFLAFTPVGDQTPLADLAGEVVMRLDEYRAPPSADELARRRKSKLNPEQERNLRDWGYPYVLDQFKFHLTLTGPLKDPQAVMPHVAAHFEPVLPRPFVIDSLTLVGQRKDGMFQELHRYTLTG